MVSNGPAIVAWAVPETLVNDSGQDTVGQREDGVAAHSRSHLLWSAALSVQIGLPAGCGGAVLTWLVSSSRCAGAGPVTTVARPDP